MIAHVQYRRGLPATEGCYGAWRALGDRGWEIKPFERVDEIRPDPEHPVIGGVDQVVDALHRVGVTPPDIDYPTALRPFLLDPQLSTRTMFWVRHARDEWPLFVKPTTGRKEFTGRVVHRTDDLVGLAHIDDELPVFVSRPVDLRGRVEWRAFVIDGKVRDIRPYTGCPDGTAPATVFVQMLVNQWQSHPTGCSIDVVDVGGQARPDWRVVECNDGYSLGSYGLHPHTYAELIVKRWTELTGGESWWD
ncbi:MAG: ATP-grasp domain-containing protein [Ilumatobacteraceae bacterium]